MEATRPTAKWLAKEIYVTPAVLLFIPKMEHTM